MKKDIAPLLINLTADQEERLHAALDMMVRYLLAHLPSEHQNIIDVGCTCTQAQTLPKVNNTISDNP